MLEKLNSRKELRHLLHIYLKLSADQLEFERIHSFTSLSSIITDENKNAERTFTKIFKLNLCYEQIFN